MKVAFVYILSTNHLLSHQWIREHVGQPDWTGTILECPTWAHFMQDILTCKLKVEFLKSDKQNQRHKIARDIGNFLRASFGNYCKICRLNIKSFSHWNKHEIKIKLSCVNSDCPAWSQFMQNKCPTWAKKFSYTLYLIKTIWQKHRLWTKLVMYISVQF